jgi:RimJ/RimL family protein N-acetyltransferase
MSGNIATAEMGIPTITTRRLVLRAFTEQDVEPLYRILSEDGVLRYFPNSNPPPLDRIQKMIAHQREHWKELWTTLRPNASWKSWACHFSIRLTCGEWSAIATRWRAQPGIKAAD